MASLRRNDGKFVLDCSEAVGLLVGDAGAAHAHIPDCDARSVALMADTRRKFIAGLLLTWSQDRTAMLAPSRQLLARLKFEGPQVTFSEGESLLGIATFAPSKTICEVLTSGSTGEPQIFPKTAAQLMIEAEALVEALSLGDGDCVLATTAPHHLYGLLFGLLAPWAAGARIVVDPKNEPSAFHPDAIAHLIAKHQVTRLVTVPAHLRSLLSARVDLSPLRTVVSSAAPLDPGIAKEFEKLYSVEVIDVLGSTETGGIATRRPAQSAAWKPLPGVQIQLDEAQLIIRSPFLEDPNAAVTTGEGARINSDGTFEHLGRADGVVKVGGKRVSLQEIERLTLAIPGVSDAVAIHRDVSSLRGQELLLAVASSSISKDDLRAALRKELEPLFVPRKIRILDALPRDERGKVKRGDIERLFAAAVVSFPPPIEIPLTIDAHSPRFEGHFTGDPLLPALAQLADIVLPHIRKNFGGGPLRELTRVKWLVPLRPGTEIALRLQQKPTGVHFEIVAGETACCSGTARLEADTPQ